MSAIALALGVYLGHYYHAHTQPALPIDHAQIAFTPGYNCTGLIIDTIAQARSSIYVQAYGFTCPSITTALIDAAHRGVQVRIILDYKSNAKDPRPNHALNALKSVKSIDIAYDPIAGIAHNKVMIIDEHMTITGSFNFTNSAQKRNAENVIILNNKRIANTYLSNWQKRRAASRVLG